MITVTQGTPTKIPGEISFYVSFNYNEKVIDVIKSLQASHYNAKTKVWEISVVDLSEFLDAVAGIDDIKLQLLQDTISYCLQYDLQKYKTTPFQYQLDAIQYGLNHDKWLLLDAPGLGKSLTAIYLAKELKRRTNIKHCLIICGINTLKTNWKKEIERHSDLTCKILGEKVSKSGKVSVGALSDRLQQLKQPINEFFVITNIETLRDEKIVKELNSGKNNIFDMIVVDEIHAAKNPHSAQGKGLLKLTNAKYKVGMTGTLMMSNPCDCYLSLKWIGAEHSNFSTFKYYYCIYGGQFGHDLLGYKNMNVLKSQLESHSLRRTKDILNLPPKTIINEYVEMLPEQAKFYEDIKKGVSEQVDKVVIVPQQVLSMLLRLRQATACPQMLTSDNIVSAKVSRCMDLTEQILQNDGKVVIFSTFKETANFLYEQLKHLGAVLCTGDIPDDDISNNINMFQTNPNCKIFIATWQKCGTGITLTAANYMIFIDTPWTPAVYEQAQDRIYRVGTQNSVTIYNLICSNTVDERVLEIVSDKEMLIDYVVDDKISANTYEKLKSIIMELKNEGR